MDALPPHQYIQNPGYLKLDLMIQGVRVDPLIVKKGFVLKNYELGPGHYGNLNLILPDDTHVSVPYLEKDVESSPYRLRFIQGKFFLTTNQERLEVKLIPHPKFYDQKINDHMTIGQVAQCHGSYVSLALAGHRYLQPHIPLGDVSPEDALISVDETIATLERIRKDGALDVVTLSCWAATGEDGGIEQIEEYIRAIKSSFNVLLFVEVHPPLKKSWIDKTYAMGADSVCYHLGNLCNHGEGGVPVVQQESLQEMEMLAHAVSIFPPGSILCHITMGNRPYKEVMKDIDELTKMGVMPILTPESREVILAESIGTDELAPLYGYVYNQAKECSITMNWFSKLAPFIAPIEGRHFSGDSPRIKLALMNFYQSRLFGGSISAALSNLRRRLRVKEVRSKRK